MLIKVIYNDGTSGLVRASTIGGLMEKHKIIAFLLSEGWVEVRRKSNGPFNGVDRRKTDPNRFYSGFQL